MRGAYDDQGGGYLSLVVRDLAELDEIVLACQQAGAFAFDVETAGTLDRHPDVVAIMEQEIASHLESLKNKGDSTTASVRTRLEAKYTGQLALDPTRNEVTWLGIATAGRSWAIPFSHPKGIMLEAEYVSDGTTTPPPGYRKLLPSGKESMAKAKYTIPATFAPAPEQLKRSVVLGKLRPLFFSDLVKVGHNIKFDARSLGKYFGEIPPGPYHDTMLAQHIVNENLARYGLEQVIMTNYGLHNAYREGKLGKVINEVAFDAAARYLHLDVRWTWLLWNRLLHIIDAKGRLREAFDLDVEVLRVLMVMEDNGIPVDIEAMRSLEKEFDHQLTEIRRDIIGMAYPGFNPDSTNDKKLFLFGPPSEMGLGLTPVKYTDKGSPSTDAESLEQMSDAHPIIPKILEWQTTKKLKSTYVDGLLVQLNQGRLHPSFHLHRTATGRLSSSNPNLQNIPRESSIRGLFVATPGNLLLVADYDQIELRVMAMLSQDPEMLKVFRTGTDIHSGAAALIYDKDVSTVSDDERQIGKMVNFLTAYGGGSHKLARQTGISVQRAAQVIKQYYEGFSGLRAWKGKVVRQAQAKGYVTTMSGRRRRLPDINSPNDEFRSRAERQAVNAVVQGTAADLCKQAMVAVYNSFQGTDAKLLVQVHDELVILSPEQHAEEYSATLIKSMGDGIVIDGVPLKVSCHNAVSWSEAKGK
jgi:DNA polymerase I